MSSLFNQRSQYTDPNAENSYQNSYQNTGSYHSEDLFSSSSSSSSTPIHSSNTNPKSSNESSNLLKESSPQRPKKSSSNGSDTRISKEEKLLDFGSAEVKPKRNSSGKSLDWNEWDDDAWTKLEVEAPKPKKNSKRS